MIKAAPAPCLYRRRRIKQEGTLVEIVYFTLAAILLYLLADWILRRIEAYLGRVLEQRTVVFFIILLTLALASFAAIRAYTGG